MRFMNRSGIQLAVFMSWVRRRRRRVAAQLEEVLDVVVPGLQVGAAAAPALAAWLTATSWSLCSLRKG
jgi:Flp pilus assembly protein TadB